MGRRRGGARRLCRCGGCCALGLFLCGSLRLLALGSHRLFTHGALGLLGLLVFVLAAQLLCLALAVRRDLRLNGLRWARRPLRLFGWLVIREGSPWLDGLDGLPRLPWLHRWHGWLCGTRARHLCVGRARCARRA
jgi:hypothetical protein